MICVEVVNGTLVVVDPQPAVVAECGLVVSSGLEAFQSPWVMSLSDGALIGSAIVGAWAIAWGFRLLVQALNVGG